MYSLGIRSLSNLQGVHDDLAMVIEKAITSSPHDFAVTEGLRSPTRQQRLVDEGKSKTLNSRHVTGHAVDIVVLIDGEACWDFDKYKEVADHIKEVAEELAIPIKWGGDWATFRDGPHFELDKRYYP